MKHIVNKGFKQVLRSVWLLIIISSLFVGCKANYHAEYDKTVDFEVFTTYSYLGWTEESNQVLDIFDQVIVEQEFSKRFAQRGLNYVEKDGQLTISLFVVVDQKTAVTAYNNHYGGGGWGYGYSGWGWGMGYTSTRYREFDYHVGTLICDVFDTKSKMLIWQGVISQVLNENPNTRERDVNRNIAFLMKKFPKEKIK